MKKLLVAVVSLGIIIPAVAQIAKPQNQAKTVKVQDRKEGRAKSKITPEHYAERKVAVLDQNVGLSADQKKQAYNAFMENASKRIGAIGTDAKTISEINAIEQEKIAKILTPAQIQKIEKAKEENVAKKNAVRESREVKRSSNDANLEREPLKKQLSK